MRKVVCREGARPDDAFLVQAVNIYTRYEDYERGVKYGFSAEPFSKKERDDFSGICEFGAEQVFECYRRIDTPVTPALINCACHECPFKYQNNYFDRFGLRHEPSVVDVALAEIDKHEAVDGRINNCVYFITDGQYIKIGSGNPFNRLTGIQTGNPRRCSILAAFVCKSRNEATLCEKNLHSMLSDKRRCGEWFDIYDLFVSNERFIALGNIFKKD